MTNKYLFLDIDGVLHPSDTYTEGLFRWLPLLLTAIEPYPDLKIVVHSSWRLAHRDFQDLLSQLPQELREKVFAVTPIDQWERWKSILQYCADNTIDLEDYLILDDARAEFPWGSTQLIWTPGKHGLSNDKAYNQLIARLKYMHE